MAPNEKTTACIVRFKEEHTPGGIRENVVITYGAKSVLITRFPWSVNGKAQPEAQDISEFIGEMQ